ncbi:MAG TPA: T9SS type A sorting domain-containing protein [Saprospiraceae bacterium]|nr:T9SS type A sorting domain-containing protein [Saprospiraceae bacterium]
MRPTFVFLIIHLAIVNICRTQPIILYPGDANNDGVANHYDLLPIGIAYGKIGPPRFFPSPVWAPQQAQAWAPQVLPVSQIDLAFVDCSGNGLIDSTDAGLIAFNYDSTQSNAVPPPFPYIELLTQFCFTCPQPEIVVTFDQDTVGSPDTFSATFVLRYPPNVPPPLGALGIAFDVEYDYDPDQIIDSLTRIYPDTIPDDRMYVVATHTKAVATGLLPKMAGSIGFAAAGKGKNVYFKPVTPLFTVEFVIEDMIIRDGSEALKFSFTISNVLILNELEQIIGLGGIKMDTVVVATKNLAGKVPAVSISPNPVLDMLIIESPESPIEKIEVISLSGERILSVAADEQNRVEVPAASLSPGVWLAVIQTKNGFSTRQFVKY